MNKSTLRQVELWVTSQDAREGYYREVAEALLKHVRELQGFVSDLVVHLDSAGPSPQKTAAYYQVAARARELARSFNIPDC